MSSSPKFKIPLWRFSFQRLNGSEAKMILHQEFRLSAQIGEYDVDNVILDLGSDVNVLLKKTREMMGKPKMI
jgi:hypothetical protein